jgi:type VII secretion integral membrane protein EccD
VTAAETREGAQSSVRLTRVVVFVSGDTEIDYVLPAGVALIAAVEDLIPRINEVLRHKGRAVLDAEQTYQLCRADSRPLDPQQSLDEAGVFDGDALWLLPVEATERFEPVTENVSSAIAREATRQFERVDQTVARRVACVLGAGLIGWAELIVLRLWWHLGGWVPAAASWALAVVVVVAAVMASRAVDEERRAASDGFAWIALIPVSAAAAMSVPGQHSGWHALAALCAGLAGVVVLVVITDRHLTAVAALLTVGAFAGAALLVASSGWQVPSQRVAVVALVVVLGLVTFATNLGVIGSGVPGPWFPSVTGAGVFANVPGTPRDTVSPVYPAGTESPADIAAWTRRGNAIVTGVLLGCGAVTVVAARYAVIPGQPGAWKYLAFTLGICAILLLRGRSFVDRWQSVTLAVASTAAVAVVIGRYAAASTPPSVTVTWICAAATLVLVVIALTGALVIATAKISAPVRKAVEVSEWVLLIFVLPWAVWLLGLLSWARHLVGGS